MPDELTDSQISLLCDIGERDPAKLTAPEAADLELLRGSGYIEPASNGVGPKVKLTAKAVTFLGERGAGLNEG